MSKKTSIKPLGDRILVQPLSESDKAGKTASGIIIPDTASKEKSEQGKVIAVGPGKINDQGKLVPVAVKKGQIVLFSKYGPDEIKVDGQEYLVVSEANILAVIE